MDLQPSNTTQSPANSTQPDQTHSSTQPSTSSSSPTTNSRTLRQSARVKEAKQKEKERQQARDSDQPDQPTQSINAPRQTRSLAHSSKNKRARDATSTPAKGKDNDTLEDSSRTTKRARRTLPIPSASASTSISAPLTINEPTKDRKGKKRAAPDDNDEEDDAANTLSHKRPRAISYSLRSRPEPESISSSMPKKTRATPSKGKSPSKSKFAATASSSRMGDDDHDTMDVEAFKGEDSDLDEHVASRAEDDDGTDSEGNGEHDDDHAGEGEGTERGGDDMGDEGESPISPGLSRGFGGLDEATAMAIFGDYRQLASHMMSLSGRLKTMLNNIKASADPTTRMVTLQELSELLSISTEDTLAGSFQVEQFVKELVRILGGKSQDDDEEEGDGEHDADLAAALALSNGGMAYQGDENLEAQVLACRCLANLMEALPGVAHTVVYHGAIPVLCSKLIEISYIDLAEQTLSTLEKISEEFPSSIVREGGLSALLSYLDFFSVAVQRTALQAAANCCKNISTEHFTMIQGVWPIIRNCLSYSDQRLVEFACLCVIRVIDSYHRSSTENLENLLDTEAVGAINQLLMPPGGSPLIAANTYTLLLRALATAARSSPKITVALLKADIVDTLYQILTGVLPSSVSPTPAEDGQGLGGDITHMTVMENLAHRPKDQVEEALSLISELMPPLPKDGVFDHKGYTDRAFAKMVRAKARAERAAAKGLSITSGTPSADIPSVPPTPAPFEGDQEGGADQQVQEVEENPAPTPQTIEASNDRAEMLQSQPEVVGRFMHLVVPILIDVYSASVITPVRVKTLTGLLKAVSFLEGESLKDVFKFGNVASFASAILSSKDHPSLVIGALQLVELLLVKMPSEYRPALRREGVFHEVDVFAARSLVAKSKDKDKDKDNIPDAAADLIAAYNASGSAIPGFKKLSSMSIDPEDAITMRARVIRFKFSFGQEEIDGDTTFEDLKDLMQRIVAPNASEASAQTVVRELATLLGSRSSVSSFELLQSGAVDGLLQFATDPSRTIPLKRRQELLLECFTYRPRGVPVSQSPFSTLVKKLQESLTRMEAFEVATVAQDSKRSSPSLLARQIRLRLTADEESDIPRTLQNMVVSIHAIATFQALNDYLRPRVAGLMSNNRLSGMLAALAASGLGSSSRDPGPPPKAPSRPISPTPAPGEKSVGRRRSQRLSAKSEAAPTSGSSVQAASAPAAAENTAEETAPASSTSAPAVAVSPEERHSPPFIPESDFGADLTDDEVHAEVFEDDEDLDRPTEKTVSVAVADDGTKVVAQTPDGTRVATPSSIAPFSSSRSAGAAMSSYAAALKSKPSDWHLEFTMDDQVLPLDLTIYGAIHQHELRSKSGNVSSSALWQGLHTVKFKKVPGPPPAPEVRDQVGHKVRSPSPTLSSLPEDAPHAKILRLLRVLHKLNASEMDKPTKPLDQRALDENAFINKKLSAKLTRQLEEPMIVASSCLPDWALDLPQNFPFLFPFATRYNYLQSTSFGYARLILKWQSQQVRGQDNSRRDDGIGFLGRLQRQKVRISRKHILESAVKVFELYGSSSSILEVEYFDEVGTGLGPTLEFYSLVSKEFARRDLKIWRDADATRSGTYVHHPTGLYPAPISPDDVSNDGSQKRTHILRVVGQFVAKAMLDSRIIDMSLNKVFIKQVLGEDVPVTIDTLRLVDKDLANSLAKLQGYASCKGQAEKIRNKVALMDIVNIDDLALDFTIPGYDIELRPGGRDIPVTSDNAEQYIQEVLNAIIGSGARAQAKAFREGFSKVFSISDLHSFSPDELVMLFGNTDEDWSLETLTESIKADHGFHMDSRAIHDLMDIMSEYDVTSRRDFLQFITGSPKLPIGGFRGLNPPFTVVRKPHEAPLTADDYLPSVMTCVNYLKLPEYSSKKVMKEKLRVAMKEGVGSFHLS